MAKISRKRFTDGLRNAAVAGGAVSTLLGLMVIFAGIALTHTRDGIPQKLLLKDLALVSFDGVVANNETTEFLVHIHWFLGYLAWEFPGAPPGTPDAGAMRKGLFPTSTFSEDMYKIGAVAGRACGAKVRDGPDCTREWFEAYADFRTTAIDDFNSITRLLSLSLVLAVFLSCVTLANEYLIVYRPHWMRCRCLILKRFCPCPRGTREQLEKLDDFVWDRVRLTYWACMVFAFGAPAFQVGIASRLMLKILSYLDKDLPEGLKMKAHRGSRMDAALFGAWVCTIISTVCIFLKYRQSRKLGSVADEQRLERGSSEHDEGRADVREDDKNGSSRYID